MSSKFLASVRSLDEARTAFAAGADIIDLKEPLAGALGAVSHAVAREVVAFVDGRAPVSATIGDLHGDMRRIGDAVRRMADTGVAIVKVGCFADDERPALMDALAPLARAGTRMVAVLFADRAPGLDAGDVARAGLHGVMLDTADKRSGSLRTLLADDALRGFVEQARASGLYCGLAGGLQVADVEPLVEIDPDYLGFRGALCRHHERGAALDPERTRSVRARIAGPGGRYDAVRADKSSLTPFIY